MSHCSLDHLEESESEDICSSFLQGYLQKDFAASCQENCYDYHSSTVNNAKTTIQFDHIDKNQCALDELIEQNPQIMETLMKLDSIQSDLTWNKLENNNGTYIGEMSSDEFKSGRGYYRFNDGGHYIGYWEKGLQSGFGRYYPDKNLYDGLNFMSYEGEYLNGIYHGQGSYFNKDGSKYVGEFLCGQRLGK